MMVPLWLLLKFTGLLRVDPAHETAGLDVSHHGGSAYPGADLESSDHKGQQYNAGMVSPAEPCTAVKATTHQTCSMPSHVLLHHWLYGSALCCSCSSVDCSACTLCRSAPSAASQPLFTDSHCWAAALHVLQSHAVIDGAFLLLSAEWQPPRPD